jgi:hypothetical protein
MAPRKEKSEKVAANEGQLSSMFSTSQLCIDQRARAALTSSKAAETILRYLRQQKYA